MSPTDAKKWKKEIKAQKANPDFSQGSNILAAAKLVPDSSKSSSKQQTTPTPTRSRSRERQGRARSRSRSPGDHNKHDNNHGDHLLEMIQNLRSEVEALKNKNSLEEGEEGEEMFTLCARFPDVRAPKEKMRQKLGASSKLGQVKGVYDLLVSRADQAEFSGKGNGKFDAVPPAIFGAMEAFFTKRFKMDASPMIVEAINEKGAQARCDKKRRESAKRNGQKEAKTRGRHKDSDDNGDQEHDGDHE